MFLRQKHSQQQETFPSKQRQPKKLASIVIIIIVVNLSTIDNDSNISSMFQVPLNTLWTRNQQSDFEQRLVLGAEIERMKTTSNTIM